uniref:Chromo domain-containing protein n=1 Tax=Panagrolaimus sp. JU765 TaxID=591449 RepID=A0AC34QB50_9BILA
MNVGPQTVHLVSQVPTDLFVAAAQTVGQRSTSLRENTESSAESGMDKSEEESVDEPFVESNGNPGGEDEIYEVDRILQTRMQGKARMFLVRWKNYGPDADSWEPYDVLKDGAEESVKEFMEEYEKNKAAKKKSKKSTSSTTNTQTRKRGRSTRNSSIPGDKQLDSKMHVETDKEPTSEEDNWSDDDDGGTSSKKKTRKKTKLEKTAETPKAVTKPKPVNLNKTPWFMDSSSDSDSDKLPKKATKPTSTDSPQGRPLPSIETELPSPSSKPTNGIVPKIKIIQSPQVPSDSRPDESVSDLSKMEEKKHKKDKNKKKHKNRLVFEGIFRKSNREPLNFVAKNAENSETRILTQEEAIDADSRSLARFLIGKITFDVNGSITVNGGANTPTHH